MIIALPNYDDPDGYYSQTNNVVETILGKTGANRRLETCGPTAAIMLIHALGQANALAIKTPGGWQPQPEDVLTLWMNDSRNYPAMRRARPEIEPEEFMGNQVPQYYPPALEAVFGVWAAFAWGCTEDQIRGALEAGRGILATMIFPGHYIAIVGYDTETREVIYHDPWPGNVWPSRYAGKPGRLRRMQQGDLINLKQHRVEIG